MEEWALQGRDPIASSFVKTDEMGLPLYSEKFQALSEDRRIHRITRNFLILADLTAAPEN
ncbi:hypothetical protein ACFL34_01665 [Candidatus Sumerlaeota bacterium]